MDWKQAKTKLLQDSATRKEYEKIDLSFEIGKMITDARIAKKITQSKLAEMVGTKQPSIARLEKGNTLPSLSFLQKIAKAFNTQLLPPSFEFMEKSRHIVTSRLVVTFQPTSHQSWFTEQSNPRLQRYELSAVNTLETDKEISYATY